MTNLRRSMILLKIASLILLDIIIANILVTLKVKLSEAESVSLKLSLSKI